MTCELGCPKRAIYKGEERILVCSDCYPRIEEASSEEARGVIQRLSDALREVKAEAIREYVTAARENPHTYYWPPSGVLDDAEQWADEIEKGTF